LVLALEIWHKGNNSPLISVVLNTEKQDQWVTLPGCHHCSEVSSVL